MANIPEVLENILVFLPREKVLQLAAKGHVFKGAIDESPNLRKKLCKSPSRDSHYVYAQPTGTTIYANHTVPASVLMPETSKECPKLRYNDLIFTNQGPNSDVLPSEQVDSGGDKQDYQPHGNRHLCSRVETWFIGKIDSDVGFHLRVPLDLIRKVCKVSSPSCYDMFLTQPPVSKIWVVLVFTCEVGPDDFTLVEIREEEGVRVRHSIALLKGVKRETGREHLIDAKKSFIDIYDKPDAVNTADIQALYGFHVAHAPDGTQAKERGPGTST